MGLLKGNYRAQTCIGCLVTSTASKVLFLSRNQTFSGRLLVHRTCYYLREGNLIYSFTQRKEEGIFEAASSFGLKQNEAIVKTCFKCSFCAAVVAKSGRRSLRPLHRYSLFEHTALEKKV